MIRYFTAGESHGRAMMGVIEGIPAGLPIAKETIDRELARRQQGYGRGGRMKIEKDEAVILSGVRGGKAIGSPITILVENKDWANWQEVMAVEDTGQAPGRQVTRPRPGHADLSGGAKFGHQDLRDVLERASARDTAARVAAGAVAKQYLGRFSILVVSYVVELGGIAARGAEERGANALAKFEAAEASEVRTFDRDAESAMKAEIDRAREKGDTLGGLFEVVALNVPPGIGSYTQWDMRLDGRLARALMSIPAIKGVEVGLGFQVARRYGSSVHDEIYLRGEEGTAWPYGRRSNNAGGLEGGTTNGEPVVLRAAMKPISTLRVPLESVDLRTREALKAHFERSDVCAVPAAAVVGEAVVGLEFAAAMSEKFGGDSIEEVERNFRGYLENLRDF